MGGNVDEAKLAMLSGADAQSPRTRDDDIDPTRRVVVSADGPRLSFHDPEALPSTCGMITTTVETARDDGAVACSACFEAQDAVQYDFPYVTGEPISTF